MNDRKLLPRSFYWNVVIRLLLLSATALGFAWSIMHIVDEYYLLTINLGLIFILQGWLLFRYFLRIDRDLTRMLEALRTNELSLRLFDPKKSKGFDRFRQVMEQINEVIKEKSLELQEQEIGYQEVINMSPVALVIFTPSGHVLYANTAAQKSLEFGALHHINDFAQLADELPKLIQRNPTNTSFQTGTLLCKKTIITTKGGEKTLLAFENISRPLIVKEMESWEKLIRVIRHEIMNSISPIPALSQSLRSGLHGSKKQLKEISQLTNNDLRRLSQGLETIEQTSESILEFVSRYRELTALPEPNLVTSDLHAIMVDSLALFHEEIVKKSIQLDVIKTETDCMVSVDPDLIKRVLINLIKNGIEAVENIPHPKLTVSVKPVLSGLQIAVKDNGPGMHAELIDQIFVPFFTTKAKGSGIGLSLSRQIMISHNGSLEVSSRAGQGSCFTATLPQ